MPALTDRRGARARLRAAFEAELDRLVPEDESRGLQGQFFRDWEDQADELTALIGRSFLLERSKLEENAQHEHAGSCPHCGESDHTYLLKYRPRGQLISRYGEVPVSQQTARCGRCQRTFSPSGARVASCGGGSADSQGGGEGGSGGGDAKL